MARYYCEYCHSYLTHDTLSVRKSHLIGKNHLRITADYYRNKHVQEQTTKQSSKKRFGKGHHGKQQQPVMKMHCLSKKEKRLQRRTHASHSKQLQTNSTLLQNDLSKIYYGSPGYSKIWIDRNRFDIGDLVKIAGVPKRANVAATAIGATTITAAAGLDASANTHTLLSQQHRDHIYSQREVMDKPIQLQLQPPMILSQWNNTVPRYTTYDDNGTQLRHTAEIITRKRTRHPDNDSDGPGATANKRYHHRSVNRTT
ncbi:hypothetical protein C6P45_001748 [Maudiozyma exigua]|uniref:Matrin-type domain-containing protein n=1 Tax=Maudiozyma exigua TaxID=34358 RepID=A0A9P6VYR9_MAUEX|nr:hypothetical protein C6P45_001748 [Kazachstania exigua]